MLRRLLSLLAFFLPAAAFAATPPDYLRYAEDANSARLEVAIKTFTLPSGQKVDLVGAVHIADAAYFEDLNQRFRAYDSVLFELVGDPRGLQQSTPAESQEIRAGSGAIGIIQQVMSNSLHLTFQLNAIDYSATNMVHADMSAAEFERMQAARGESMATMFIRAMQAQSNGALAAADELDTFALIRILLSPDSATEFKKSLAKMFDQMESMSAALEGKNGSAVLSDRNDVAVKKMKEVLAGRKQRHIAVFYGGAHMPGIEAALLKDLNASPSGEQWLPAWTMPK